MTDDERIERLTKLARKIWDEETLNVSFQRLENGYEYAQVIEPNDWESLCSAHAHPRALDALEAALFLLAGEPSDAEEHWIKRAETLAAEAIKAEERLSAMIRELEDFMDEALYLPCTHDEYRARLMCVIAKAKS